MKSISVDPDFIIHDLEDNVLYKGDRKYGAIKFYELLRKILNDKQMLDWVDGDIYTFKISDAKYNLILNADRNG